MYRKRTYRENIFLLLSLGLVVLMIATSLCYASNIPYFDDYNLVLDYLCEYAQANSLGQKISLIWEPRNGHRIAFFHFLALTDWILFGSVNFVHLILIANLGWLLVIYLTVVRTIKESIGSQHVLVLTFFMAIPAWAVLNWSASGLTGTWMITFVLLSLQGLNGESRFSFVQAVTFAVLATFTFGGGLLVFIAGIPLLRRKSVHKILIWVAFFVLCLVGYLWGISFGSSTSETFAFLMGKPHIVVANCLLFFGAPFKVVYGEQHFWSLVFGLLVWLVSILMLFQSNLRRSRPMLYSGLFFFLALGVLTALMRSQFGLGATTAYRYRFFQIMPLVFLYLGFLERWPSAIKRVFPILLGIVSLFFGLRYFDNLDRLQFLEHRLEMGLLSYQLTEKADQLSFRVPEQAGPIYDRAVELGVYDPPSWTSFYQTQGELNLPPQEIPLQLHVDEEFEDEEVYQLRGWVFPKYRKFDDLDIMGVVNVGGRQRLLPTGPFIHPTALIEQNPSAFVLTIPKAFFEEAVIVEGIALYHPLKGVVGVTKIPEE